MVILSAGMQKSGSAYIYNIINNILIFSGYKDARQIKDRYGLSELLKWHNNNVGDFTFKNLFKLLAIGFQEKKFAIKTHSGPTTLVNSLLKLGLIKAIYIYRDPRDVMVSAMDHGKKIIEQGENHTFAEMVDFDVAIKNIKSWVDVFYKYQKNPNVLTVKYEDLMLRPNDTIKHICEYLSVNISATQAETILNKYSKDNPNADMKGLHFNKAELGRYKSMTSDQLQLIEMELGADIRFMGYAL